MLRFPIYDKSEAEANCKYFKPVVLVSAVSIAVGTTPGIYCLVSNNDNKNASNKLLSKSTFYPPDAYGARVDALGAFKPVNRG